MGTEAQHTEGPAGTSSGAVAERAPAGGDEVAGAERFSSERELHIGQKTQLVCLWAGLVMVAGLIVGLVTAGWVPPPLPNESASQVAAMYVEHQGRIRAGVLILFSTTPLALPFCVVIAMHMKVRGRWSPWAFVHIGSSVMTTIPTLVAHFLWPTAAYRPQERTAGEIKLFHDAGWLNIVGCVPPSMLLCVSVTAFVLTNEGHRFPRWVGYFSAWWALLILPGLFVYCFDTGPLAWDGIFTFWLAAAWVLAWYTTMFVILRRIVLTSEQPRAARDSSESDQRAPSL